MESPCFSRPQSTASHLFARTRSFHRPTYKRPAHHPSQHKRSIARSLLDRAKNISSTDADRLSKIQHVVDALKISGYTKQFIRSCQSTTVSTNQGRTNRGFVTLPYLQGISEKIARTLNHFNINVAHKPVMTVGSILKKPKDKTNIKGLKIQN